MNKLGKSASNGTALQSGEAAPVEELAGTAACDAAPDHERGDLPVALDERIQSQIGQQLSSFYRELVNQPIPDSFMDLLAKLDQAEQKSSGPDTDSGNGTKGGA